MVEISPGSVREGELPRKVAAIVREWCLLHQTELLENWVRAQELCHLTVTG